MSGSLRPGRCCSEQNGIAPAARGFEPSCFPCDQQHRPSWTFRRTSPFDPDLVRAGKGFERAERQDGFFDVDACSQRLNSLRDQLEAHARAVDFELSRSVLEAALADADGCEGGRPPFDSLMMVKILVIRAPNTLQAERAEFVANDRLSFIRFFGWCVGARMPDATTILAVPRAAGHGGWEQAAVRPGGVRCRLSRDKRPDRRRLAGGGRSRVGLQGPAP